MPSYCITSNYFTFNFFVDLKLDIVIIFQYMHILYTVIAIVIWVGS